MTAGKGRRHIFLVLRVVVVACGVGWGVYWISQGQRWANLTKVFREMNLWIFAAATIMFAAGNVIAAMRWWLLLKTQKVFIGLREAVVLFFLGWFYNNFMPSSVGGDLVRAWYVTKHTDKKFESALSVFVDRGIGLVGTLIILAYYYVFFFLRQGKSLSLIAGGGFLKSVARYEAAGLWVLIAVAVGFLAFLAFAKGRECLRKIWSHILIYGLKIIQKLKVAVVVYCSRPLVILLTVVITVLMQLGIINGFWLLGVNLGVAVGVEYYYLFITFIWLVGVLPVSIGGAVVMEGGLAYLFVRYTGVTAEAALALALCQRIIWMLTSLPGAVIHMSGFHLPKDFFVDPDESIG
jgi:uncharacterized protein (TIRG00374 family)